MEIRGEVLNVVLKELPTAVELFKLLFKKSNPGAPPPTDEEILLASAKAIGEYRQTLASSTAKDEAWLAAHPRTPDGGPVGPGE